MTENTILTDGELAASLGGELLIIIQLLLPFLCKFYKMARVPNLRSGPDRRTSDMTNRFQPFEPNYSPFTSFPNQTPHGSARFSNGSISIRVD